jgi:hypothetical protein
MTSSPQSWCETTTVFAIPLKSRTRCPDWRTTELYLRRPIRSIQRAARGHRALVCVACHESPALDDVDEQGVVLLPVGFPPPSVVGEGNRDKARKRRHIGAWVRETVREDVRIAFVDADDLVHHRFLDAIAESKADSQLITDGYFVDTARGVVSLRRGMFHRSCGSSFVCRFRRDELPESWEDLDAPFSQFGGSPEKRGHADYGDVAAELGRPPAPLGLPGIAYLVNHEGSLSVSKRGSRVLDYPFELVWPRTARRILSDEFGADDLAAGLVGTHLAASAYARACIRYGRRRLTVVTPCASARGVGA